MGIDTINPGNTNSPNILACPQEGYFKKVGCILDGVKNSLEKSADEVMRKFSESGAQAKERFLLFMLLNKFGVADIDHTTPIDNLQAHFTEEFAEKTGLYYVIGSGWYSQGTAVGFFKGENAKDSYEGYSISTALKRNSRESRGHPVADKTLNGIRAAAELFDKMYSKKIPKDQQLAKEHSEEWYINYKTLQSMGFNADPLLSDREMSHAYDRELSFFLKTTRGVPMDSYIHKGTIDTTREIFRKQYNEMKEATLQ